MCKKNRGENRNLAEEKESTKILNKEKNKYENKLAEEKESVKMLMNDKDKIKKKCFHLRRI